VFIKVMEEQDQAATRQSVPITTRVLLKWFKALPSDDKHASLLKAMLLTGQCALPRACENENTRRKNQKTVSAGYRVADITWRGDGAAFTLALGLTKGNRSFGGDTVTIANATPVSATRRYLLEMGLMDRPDAVLYPQYVTDGWANHYVDWRGQRAMTRRASPLTAYAREARRTSWKAAWHIRHSRRRTMEK
jgi:hypothetical protein